ncbi:MAG: hypothetical protein Fur0010_15280 [Bdellovibrio sp.]
MNKKIISISILLLSCSHHPKRPHTLAYYGDFKNDRVYAVDVEEMKLAKKIDHLNGAYPIDQAGEAYSYASTRKDQTVSLLCNKTMVVKKKLNLKHTPRSSTFNPRTNMILISGGDKPMTTVVDNKTQAIIAEVGSPEYSKIEDYGGSLATGHPVWLDDEHFFQLNRVHRKIELYNLKGELLSSLKTPTATHYMALAKGGNWIVSFEGNPKKKIQPGLLSFDIKNFKFKNVKTVYLPKLTENMGTHHWDQDPASLNIFYGSTEGHTFIYEPKNLKLISIVKTGKGSGHTVFSPIHQRALVINHEDTFLTVINTETSQKINDIPVSNFSNDPHGDKIQGHTWFVKETAEKAFAYGTTPLEGNFLEVDLVQSKITRILNIGGYPVQGTLVQD